MATRKTRSRNPLVSALLALARIAEEGTGIEVSRALTVVRSALSGVIQRSDRKIAHSRDRRFSDSQAGNLKAIRKMSRAARGSPRGSFGKSSKDAREQVVRACRSQVRKVRISRSRSRDVGGEG